MDSLPLPFDAPFAAYVRQAEALLSQWRAGDREALDFFHDHHPRFRRQDVAWMPQSLSEQQLRGETFTLEDAQLAVARGCDFLDWKSLTAWVTAIETRDAEVYPFECAVEAVVRGDLETLRDLLDAHPDLVRARSTRRCPFDPPLHACTLLHYLGANGVEGYRQKTPPNALEVMALLLDRGADPNSLAFLYGGECTTLSLLVSSCHPAQAGLQAKLAELLVDRSASLAPRGSGNWTNAMMTALTFGYLDTAEALARKGAAVDTLAAAAGLNRLDLAKQMLETADPEDRHRALALAAQLGHAGIVQLLLDAGVDPNLYNPSGMHSHSTPLHQAALAGHMDVVRTLLAHPGIRLDIADPIYNSTPLGWALHGDQQEVAALLRGAMEPSARQ
jgi:hypothetical protein